MPGRRVLDIGTWHGAFLWACLQSGCISGVGIDRSDRRIFRCREIYQTLKISVPCEFRHEDVLRATLPEAEIVLCMNMLHYLNGKQQKDLLEKIFSKNPLLVVFDCNFKDVGKEKGRSNFLELLRPFSRYWMREVDLDKTAKCGFVCEAHTYL